MTEPESTHIGPRSSAFRIGWLTILIVTVAVHAYTLSKWSWYQNDLVFPREFTEMALGDYLFRPVAGHLAPGMLAIPWIITAADPMNYTWAAVIMCVLSALGVLAWGLALRELFGERVHLLAGLAIIVLSPTLLVDSLFWSRGLGNYTMQIFMGFGVWFMARLLVRGWSLRDLVGMTLVYAVGLFFWDKALLVTIPLLFLCLLLGPSDLRAAVRNCVRHLWPIAVLTVIYLPIFLLVLRDDLVVASAEPVPRSVGSLVSLFTRGALDIALPAMVGGPFDTLDTAAGDYPTAPGPLALGLFTATVVLIILAIRLRRRGWLALAMIATYAGFAYGGIFWSNRFESIGAWIIQSPHYTSDLLMVMVLGCMFVVTPTVLDTEPPLRQPVSPRALEWVRRGLLGYLALVCVAVTVTTGRTWDALEPTSSKPYFDALLDQAERLGSADVYDTRLPSQIVYPDLFPQSSWVSAALKPMELPLRFNQPTEQYVVATEQGDFREAAVVGGSVNVVPGPDGPCGFEVTTGEITTIPLSGDLFDFGWAMELTYFTGSDARIAVRTDDDRVELDVPVNEPGGLGKRQLPLSGAVTSLSIEGLSGSASVCVTDVRIGVVEPTDEVPAQLKD